MTVRTHSSVGIAVSTFANDETHTKSIFGERVATRSLLDQCVSVGWLDIRGNRSFKCVRQILQLNGRFGSITNSTFPRSQTSSRVSSTFFFFKYLGETFP